MRALKLSGETVDIAASISKTADSIIITISKDNDFSDIKSIDVEYFDHTAATGDKGYILLPRANPDIDYCISYFSNHTEDFEMKIEESNMPVFGVKNDNECYIAYVSGMSYSYSLNYSNKNGLYRLYPTFDIDGEQPYEDIRVEFFMLTGNDANYSGMARRYRSCKLERGDLSPIKERIIQTPDLAYTADSPVIRIRCAWKPAPAAVLHQTEENEPPVHVACDFDRVGDILDELKAQGIEKAEICLVGWNVKGHDGRWPDAFPVCEEAGGEEKLRKLIKKGQDMGYRMTCHTNSTDHYEISSRFSTDNIIRDKEGNLSVNPYAWSGGQTHNVCPKIGAEMHNELVPKVAELGFAQGHYLDVLGVVYPRRCYHKDHYVTYGDCVKYAKDSLDTIRKYFKTVSSEGCYDYVAPYLDYGLYVGFQSEKSELNAIVDEQVPFWQLVYHGIVMSNPYPATVNATFKGKTNILKMIEYGGRPSFYFYSAFATGNAWMGTTDALCNDDTQLKESVRKIKIGMDISKEINTETEFMENHRKISDGVYETTYSDGTVVTVDYNKETYSVLKK